MLLVRIWDQTACEGIQIVPGTTTKDVYFVTKQSGMTFQLICIPPTTLLQGRRRFYRWIPGQSSYAISPSVHHVLSWSLNRGRSWLSSLRRILSFPRTPAKLWRTRTVSVQISGEKSVDTSRGGAWNSWRPLMKPPGRPSPIGTSNHTSVSVKFLKSKDDGKADQPTGN